MPGIDKCLETEIRLVDLSWGMEDECSWVSFVLRGEDALKLVMAAQPREYTKSHTNGQFK